MSRYAEFQWGDGHWSGPTLDVTPSRRDTSPWRINKIRVEAFHTSEGLPPVVPGKSETYTVQLDDRAPDNAPTIEQRRQALIKYIQDGFKVVTYQTMRGTYFRNQAGANQLVLIEPIASGDPGTFSDPTVRQSNWEARWSVITGGEEVSKYPDEWVTLQLETVTIASKDEYSTRQELEAARERSDL